MSVDIEKLSPEAFPKRLCEIPDPPAVLWKQGVLPPEEYRWLTVVGSRRYTPYGRDAVETLIRSLSGYPVAIVSGLALGIDGLAHEAALSQHLPAVAVPGSGLGKDVLYPRQNCRLAERILEAGGALLSEFPPDFRAAPWSFPQRNRIMAGLADAVLLIEAEKQSGTLITARLAADYNRDVLVVPGSIFSKNTEGVHRLLGIGATPITSGDDLLNALGFEPQTTRNVRPDCSPEERRVIELLTEPLLRDELIRNLGLPISRANTILTSLELKGIITESMGEIRLC